MVSIHETYFSLIRTLNDEVLMVDGGTSIFGSLRTFTLVLENEIKKGRIIIVGTIWVLFTHDVGTMFHMRWAANEEVGIVDNECIVVTHLGNVLDIDS